MTNRRARVAVFNDTRGDHGHFGCKMVMDKLESMIVSAGGDVVFRWPHDRDWRQCKEELPPKGDIDAIVVNGEGTLHGAPRRQNAVALAELGAYAKSEFNVPIILLNATLYNNDTHFYSALAEFDLVFLRDTMSCKEARSNGLEGVYYCPDLTLSADVSYPNTNRQGIGVTGSVKYHDDRALRDFAKQINAEFVSMVQSHKPDLRAFLTPRIGALRVAWRTLQRHKDLDHSFRPACYAKFIDWISEKSLVVTGRYHTVSLCILTKTPFIYVESNSPKISALCIDAGLGKQRNVESALALTGRDDFASIEGNEFDRVENDAIVSFLRENKQRFEFLRGSMSKLFSARL